MRPHPVQYRLTHSKARFKIIEAGRRSGKTELAKRDEVQNLTMALLTTGRSDWRSNFYCPTRDQCKAIYWDDLNERIPDDLVIKRSVVELTIKLIGGPTVGLIGMDKPARADGPPVDSAKVDEAANMKAGAWTQNIRPSLDTDGRPGKAWIYGVTRQARWFQEVSERAQQGLDPDWEYFWWPSSEILTPEAIESAKRDMDSLTFEQEYGAKRVLMAGRAYYEFTRERNVRADLPYNPTAPLILCMDFNIAPGSAVICQEGIDPKLGACTFAIGEIHIPYGSNTPMVCRKFIADWGKHTGPVHYYGDPTGGNKGTAKTDGSDWDIVNAELRTHFAGRLHDRVNRKREGERIRINALNKRLCNALGEVHLLIDGKKCPALIRDFENVMVLEGTDGALDKDRDPSITHWTDGLGDYIRTAFPLHEHRFSVEPL